MRGRTHAKPQMTVAQSRLQLQMLLTGCSDHALAAFTPDYIARCYKVRPDEASRMLTDARKHRERLL